MLFLYAAQFGLQFFDNCAAICFGEKRHLHQAEISSKALTTAAANDTIIRYVVIML